MIKLLKGVQRVLPVYMEDSANPGQGKTGLTAPAVWYSKNGAAWTQKTDVSSWVEGDATNAKGWYQLTFTAAELGTTGWFGFSVVKTGAKDYPGLVWLDDTDDVAIKADTGAIKAKTDGLPYANTDVLTRLGTPQGASVSVDVLKAINGVFGKKVETRTGSVWNLKFYAEDNVTLVSEYDVVLTGTEETRTKK